MAFTSPFSGTPKVRKGSADPTLSHDEFVRRFKERFKDPAFDDEEDAKNRVAEAAWKGYDESRKSAHTRPAGPGFADPKQEVSVEWLATRERLIQAERTHRNPDARPRLLLINGSPRSEWTCPGELSKTHRLVDEASQAIAKIGDFEVDILDLSRLTSEFGRNIHPCKACVSTAMPLCNWPCSCYPNDAMGQVQDWMAEIYERWVLAHGVMIITPVHWYQAPSVLKLMIDRLVCADGGNPDPTSTGGKDPEAAKKLELKGWDYPKHLEGRLFAVITHGDAGGAEHVRQALTDWLNDIGLESASPQALLDRYIGYLKPYATSHDELDEDRAIMTEVQNAGAALARAVAMKRSGQLPTRPHGGDDPRPK